MEIEGARLFETGAVWQDIITNLAHGHVENEREIRERLDEFQQPEEQDPTLEDLYAVFALSAESRQGLRRTEPLDFRQIEDLDSDLPVVNRNVIRPATCSSPVTAHARSGRRATRSSSAVPFVVVHFDRAHNLFS